MRRVFHPLALLLALLYAQAFEAIGQTVQVSSKQFTSNIILGDIATLWLRQGGVEAEHRPQLGDTRFLWEALQAGEIGIYPDYTGTLIRETLVQEQLELVELDSALASYGLRMSAPLGFEDTYILGMKEERAQELGISTISDLNRYPELRFGFSSQFMSRSDGWPSLRSKYSMPHRSVRGMDHDLSYRGIEAGGIDVMDLYSIDAEIKLYDMRPLEDDLRHFPEYAAVYLYRADLDTRVPALLDSLAGTITVEAMRELNLRVVRNREAEAQVSADFLENTFDLEQPVVVEEITFWWQLWQYTKEHVILVVISLSAAILLSVPLGVLAAKFPRMGTVILGTVGVIYTIPSLALLVFMIPLLGVGGPPAMVALFLYSLLPIVRNTHAGIVGIAEPLSEAAMVLGLPPMVRLMKVELPLATRSIMAGVQTSAVINIGTATLGALIGAGGYGQPILTGIRLSDTGLILQGAVPAALMALVAQGFFTLIERVFLGETLQQK